MGIPTLLFVPFTMEIRARSRNGISRLLTNYSEASPANKYCKDTVEQFRHEYQLFVLLRLALCTKAGLITLKTI